MWRKLQQEVPHVFFNARWIKRAEKEEEMQGIDFRDLWGECQEDIKDADIVLVYAEDGDQLKGALVEVGMALAFGVQVMLVTPVEDRHVFGTWMHANGVQWATTMEDAMRRLYLMTNKGSREESLKWFAPAGLQRGAIPDDMIRSEVDLSGLDKPGRCCGGAGPDCHCD